MKQPAVTEEEVRSQVAQARARGLSVGFVPTMGALHAGHASLIEAAKRETQFVVVSIFVNPTQFVPGEDFARYPRPLTADLEMCERLGVDLVFLPEVETMYPPGSRTIVEVRELQDVLCGVSRPGHFRGVTTVVLKLFLIVQADIGYFGQKDYQQFRIIRQMVDDLNVPIALRMCPIVREEDGLALSSRNRYLDGNQRRHAVVLWQTLDEARRQIQAGQRDAAAIQRAMAARIEATPGAVLDYATVVDAETLQPVAQVGGKTLLALAVKFGSTRLIDNVVVDTTAEV